MIRNPALAASLILVAACADGPGALGPGETAQRYDAQASANAAGQTDEILALIDAQDAAWAAKDGVAYGNTYTVDAEVIAPIGSILFGRAVIAGQHVFLFNPATGPFRASTSSWTLRDLTFLTGTTALVKLDVALTGFSGLPPGLRESEPGVVRTRVTWVATKRDGQWLIMHQQMTALAPAM